MSLVQMRSRGTISSPDDDITICNDCAVAGHYADTLTPSGMRQDTVLSDTLRAASNVRLFKLHSYQKPST